MLKLKHQYIGHLMWRTDSLEKILMLGKIKGGKRRGRQRMRWLDGITVSMDVNLSKLRELVMAGKPGVLQSMGSQRVGHDWATELNWTKFCIIKLVSLYKCHSKGILPSWISTHSCQVHVEHVNTGRGHTLGYIANFNKVQRTSHTDHLLLLQRDWVRKQFLRDISKNICKPTIRTSRRTW